MIRETESGARPEMLDSSRAQEELRAMTMPARSYRYYAYYGYLSGAPGVVRG